MCWLVQSSQRGIAAFHVVCIHAYFYFVFESVTLEDKHQFKFGGVISGILYHLERLIWLELMF